jgi:hypothetical protein
MKEGKYSARVVAEVSTNKREFIITSEIKVKYQYDAQQKMGIISLDETRSSSC